MPLDKNITFPKKGIVEQDFLIVKKLADALADFAKKHEKYKLFENFKEKDIENRKYWDGELKKLRENLVPIALSMLKDAVIEKLKNLASDIMTVLESQTVAQAVLNILKVAFRGTKLYAIGEKLYFMAATQMMLAYSEDGMANSTGAGFIYKGKGMDSTTIGTGLLAPGTSYVTVQMDHLGMGVGPRSVISAAKNALTGMSGTIR